MSSSHATPFLRHVLNEYADIINVKASKAGPADQNGRTTESETTI
jgi:hypothetical protein